MTAEQAPQGDIGHMSNQDICEEIYYDGDPQKLIEALISSKLLDKSEEHRLIVHDWEKHCDQAIRRKLQRHGKSFCLVMTRHDESKLVMTILPSGTGTGSGSGLVTKNRTRNVPAREKGNGHAKLKESVVYCVSLGLLESDGQWFFDKCEGSGWTNNGKPIADWKATMRAWKAQGYMPSQKKNTQKESKDERIERIAERVRNDAKRR